MVMSGWLEEEVGWEKMPEEEGMRGKEEAAWVVLEGAVEERRETMTVDEKEGAFEIEGVKEG